MLSLEQMRREPEKVKMALVRRGEDPPVARLLEMDGRRRNLINERDTLRAKHNDLSRRFGQLRQEGGEERPAAARLNRLRQEIEH